MSECLSTAYPNMISTHTHVGTVRDRLWSMHAPLNASSFEDIQDPGRGDPTAFCKTSGLIQPFFHMCKGLTVTYVVDQDDAILTGGQ